MKYLASSLHHPVQFLLDKRNQRLLIVSSLILTLLCSLSLLVRSSARHSEAEENTYDSDVTPIAIAPASTPTKWWIKMTATTSPSMLSVSTASVESRTSSYSEMSPLMLRVKMFAYVALEPQLPNRLRARAGLSGEYIGQIESGAGLKVTDGPICVDGYTWWLVESLDKRLRGWTVEGRDSEQWLIPCPNVNVQCNFLATPTPPKVSAPDNNSANLTENACKSDRLAVGLLAHVNQDSLLVIRAEPSVGAVIGHAGPMSIVSVIEGPACVGGIIWWKVNALDLSLIGWTTENYLEACPKDSQCDQ